MTRWLWLCVFLMGLTPIYNKHDTPQKVDDEFNNFSDLAQPVQWRVLSATPTLNELVEGESVIVGSATWATQMFRFNNEIWKVQSSCATVVR